MVILYTFIEQDKHKYLLDKYSSIWSEDFDTRILKYRRWQDAQSSILGRILLQYGLNKYFGIKDYEIDQTSNHKPFLKNLEVCFNISHAGNLVICGISKLPIGVDIEYIDNKINLIDFKSQMTSNEFHKIQNSQDKIKSFFVYWTEKEAAIKAHGKGLLIPLKSFEIFQNQTIIENEKFYLKQIFIHEEYQCCVASINDIKLEDLEIEKVNINLL
ncbi:4'-phosphopantetheinyl transferase superfamily protein [Chryseobacterium sp. PS-8]|uniref:4'-phosphopantetheinyl transferase superfamily protein n=1 Tax=Chryseobacterium indicum TaxID=2766954 RepID=A0ABS9CAI0_9FLAO|nr:4'-phosphopantetheinyl transferase superfamily protein [Chryseobacterium sp. PS-8]MCF2220336.1 4'-phosphopantetheinyl transferase superfamily protein [Chryseobacterium sp. PS-8]